MQTRPKLAAPEETALFLRGRASEYILILEKNVRKIQNAAVIPAIFLDFCEA